jgi:large subunit ribosomal protein L18
MYKVVPRKTTRERRKAKIRGILVGDTVRPRLTVFRSNEYIYGQVIDDSKHTTVAAVTDLAKNQKANKGKTKMERAYEAGKTLAERALEKGIKMVRFDRNGYKFHGRVKRFADGAREGGLEL